MEKCHVEWCEAEAAFAWVRTEKQIKAMRGPKVRGVRAEAAPVRKVCAAHKPSWRDAEYTPIQES